MTAVVVDMWMRVTWRNTAKGVVIDILKVTSRPAESPSLIVTYLRPYEHIQERARFG
jgi:hypothetical protein